MPENVDASVLLAVVPPEVRKALETARDAAKRCAAGLDRNGFSIAVSETARAFDLVGIPRAEPTQRAFPLVANLDEVQRAVLLWSALEDLGVGRMFAVPGYPDTRRHWLGVGAGLLETLTVGDEPLWRALQLANETPASEAIFDALPVDVALRVLAELYTGGRAYGIRLGDERLRLFRELRDEGRAWAIELANAFPRERIGVAGPLTLWVFVALARANVPIERAWEDLYPNFQGVSRDALVECARALPEERRGVVLARHFATWQWAVDMVAAFPTAGMATALLDSTEPHGQRWTQWVAQLRELGKDHPAIAVAVEALVVATPAPIALFHTRSIRPTSAAELTPLEREQLRIGARGYDGEDLDAEARLANDDPQSETAIGTTLQVRSICDAHGEVLYDALSYFTDGGVIFRAGTTEEIGWIGQGGVVLASRNDALRLALQKAIEPFATPYRARKTKKPANKPPRK